MRETILDIHKRIQSDEALDDLGAATIEHYFMTLLSFSSAALVLIDSVDTFLNSKLRCEQIEALESMRQILKQI